MSYVADYDRSLDLAERALEQAKAHGMAPTPRNFEIWYQYVTGENQALVEDINKRISDGSKISAADATQLQNEHFSPSEDADNVVALSSKISVEVEQAISVISAAAGTNQAYGNSLESVGSQLGNVKNATDLKTVAETLVRASREMEKNSRELESKLEDSKLQISTLKDRLDEVRNESRTDGLTGIPNRKHFDEQFAEETAKAIETQEELCLVVADIDHFKSFNDTHGHQTGDQVLKLVAKLLSSNIKGRDMAARFGGEEFTILLPQTNLRAAVTVADQIREKVRTKELIKKSTNENLGTITLSLGVARYRPGESTHDLFQRADSCLYAAKHAGRDNVKCEADPDVEVSINAA